MIQGIQVTLIERTVTGQDDFGTDITEDTETVIDNVVVGQPTSEDVISEINVSGKHIAYNLAIPADDPHTWEGNLVEFYGRKWRVIGIPTQFMNGFMGADFPWNKQVRVEAYEQD